MRGPRLRPRRPGVSAMCMKASGSSPQDLGRRTPPQSPLGRGAGPQARLGQVPLVAPSPRRQVLPRGARSRWPLAHRVCGDPTSHSRAGDGRGCRRRPRRSRLGSPVDRGVRSMSRACAPTSDGASSDWSARKGRQRKGSNRRARTRLAIARLKGRETARRRDSTEKVSTDSGPPIRPDPHRGPGCAGHDEKRQGHRRPTRLQRPAEGRAEPRHPCQRVGGPPEPAGGQGPRPGGKDLSRVHEPALLGVRARRSGEPRESSVPVRRLRAPGACGHERGTEHRRRACGDCVGRRAVGRACTNREPTTLGAVAYGVRIPVLPGHGGCQSTTRMRRQFSQRLTVSGGSLRSAASSTAEIDTRQPWQVSPTRAAAPTPPWRLRTWS